jgi:pyruvate,water dikinase
LGYDQFWNHYIIECQNYKTFVQGVACVPEKERNAGLIVTLGVANLPPLAQVGGKARALVAMAQQGMPVPPGFVLTVGFFAPWTAALQATAAWQAVQAAKGDEIGSATRALQARCRDLRFDRHQREAFEEMLTSIQASCGACLFAVRSSSPEEDLEGASFAGGYETTLGVPPGELEHAVRHSFASAFGERVFVYKRERGLPTDQPRIAVIVQQQVDADSAGVAFSLNPLNNCYDEAVINANYGLGESVVSGEIDPDVFVVDKQRREIIDTQLGGKALAITISPGGGTVRASRTRSEQASLSTAQVLALTDLLVRIERISQKPVDIEWAIAQGELYLLQVRPITTYLPLPAEMLTAPGEPKRLYADSTLIEQGLEDPLSVLGADLIEYIFQVMGRPMGRVAAGVDGIAFTAGGRYYMNLSNSIRVLGRGAALAPGSHGDESVMGILDSIRLEPYLQRPLPEPLRASRRRGLLSALPLFLPVMRAFLRPEAFVRQYQRALPAHLKRFETVIDRSLPIKQQATHLMALLRFFLIEYGMPMVFAAQLAQSRIRRIFAGDEVDVQLLSLGTALPGNKTAEMGTAMAQLATSEAVRAQMPAQVFVAQLKGRALHPAFLQAWDQFVDEFGARCPREIDVATPRPNEQPALLYAQLWQMAQALDVQGRERTVFELARAKREAAYADLYDRALQKGGGRARALARLYSTWITLGGYRETGKHYVIKVVDMFRKRVLEVAQSLVEAERLDRREQIFDLTIDDIDRALANAALDLRALAQERTRFIEGAKRCRLVARVIDSRGKIYYPPRKSAAEGQLAGVAISPGVVRGRVKVLHRADEKPLLPGEILVTRATDPGWTPLFIHAGGIVLEIGGVLQHGAVVAREYGVPCVSGVIGATELLQDGQLVEVDGSNGVVRMLEAADLAGGAVGSTG